MVPLLVNRGSPLNYLRTKDMAKGGSYLCIGGPRDGRRYTSEAPYFRAPLYRPISAISPMVPPTVQDTINYVTYVAERIVTGRGASIDEVWFWRPEDQTLGETVRRILDVYEKSANINFDGPPWGKE